MRILTVIGTRPEAIKMAPVIHGLARAKGIDSVVCSSGQHRDMIKSALDIFGIVPDLDLAAMDAASTLNGLMSVIVERFDRAIDEVKPDVVLVHGDTTTTAACSMAAFHRNIKVGHVEAGLRTRDLTQPWPEEFNRRVTDIVSEYLFAPTESARNNLLAETLGPKRIYVTGNTIVDALVIARVRSDGALRAEMESKFGFLDPAKRLVLVTTHRRENFGEPLQNILKALNRIAELPDIQILLPVHLNPNVRGPVREALSGHRNIHLTEPVDYQGFMWLLDRASLIATDSGGIQEEAPSLGKPVLLMREVTERPEGVEAGFIRIVGTSAERIIASAEHYLASGAMAALEARGNPYGDGRATDRIIAALRGEPVASFSTG
jgi:UDP-N-acetylglucosamine 2-epimerase (non-hydrolysing)